MNEKIECIEKEIDIDIKYYFQKHFKKKFIKKKIENNYQKAKKINLKK